MKKKITAMTATAKSTRRKKRVELQVAWRRTTSTTRMAEVKRKREKKATCMRWRTTMRWVSLAPHLEGHSAHSPFHIRSCDKFLEMKTTTKRKLKKKRWMKENSQD